MTVESGDGQAARKRISVICPVFNERETVPVFYARFLDAVAPLRERYDIELTFTNNRSTDGTLDVIRALRARDPSVQVLTLSRNFGYQASLQAGLAHADGDAIMFIDVDCEDPPELIPEFVGIWEEGHDIVYGERGDRPEWGPIKALRNWFYHVLKALGDADIVLYMAEFALFSRHVREALINNRNTFPYIRAEIGYAGFSRHGVRYDRQARVRGETHYNILDMFAVAFGAILTSSTFPLRWAAAALPAIVLANIGALGAYLWGANPAWVTGILVFDAIYGLAMVTVHGLYLARVHKNVMGRPVYIVDRSRSFLNRPPWAQDGSSAAGCLPPAPLL